MILMTNKGLVNMLAKKYSFLYDGKIEFDDFQQEGYIGLIEATSRFDVALGYSFSTYAMHWIKQKMSRYAHNNSRLIRIPVHTGTDIYNVKKARDELTIKLDRDPTIQEIAKHLNISIEKVKYLLDISKETTSLDKCIGGEDDDITIIDVLEDLINESPGDRLIKAEFKAAVNEWVDSSLTYKEKEVISLRYGLSGNECHTLESIGNKFNLSRERIRSIEVAAKRKLRKKAYLLKLKADYIVDLKTDYYRKGKNSVIQNVIERDEERRFQLSKSDHPLYKWYKHLEHTKYKIEHDKYLSGEKSLGEIKKLINYIDDAVMSMLVDLGYQSWMIVFNRLRGNTEEEVMRLLPKNVSYYDIEQEAIDYINKYLEKCNINIKECLEKE